MVLYIKDDGILQGILAKTLKVSKATSTRSIKNLEKEGYVYRERDEKDLRAYRVYLTEEGKEVRKVILEKLVFFADMLLSDFTLEERELLRRLIRKASFKFHESEFKLLIFDRLIDE